MHLCVEENLCKMNFHRYRTAYTVSLNTNNYSGWNDYTVKIRETENAPACPAQVPNDLLSRAVTDDDYSCNENKPCSNGMWIWYLNVVLCS